MMLGRVRRAVNGMEPATGAEIQDVSRAEFTRRGGAMSYQSDPAELRSGKLSTPVAASTVAGAAVGMCCHLTSGVFCGLEDTTGATGIPGLYVAGDGIHATSPSGVGFTSCFTSIDGTHAGKAAAVYAAGAALLSLDAQALAQRIEETRAPLFQKSGFDPNWARDVLHLIMTPYWVSVAKSEPTLQAALVQVAYIRDHVVPKLMAASSHDLRLCLEVRHKVLSAELKLRAGLLSRESRGNQYRTDFPYRDDDRFLCDLVQTRGAQGGIDHKSVPVPEAWAGDRTLPYEKRYCCCFPGEPQAKGFTPPASRRGGNFR